MVASTTAGKYGVKNTSGRIWARPHRAAVLAARQRAAKPAASNGVGWVYPRQPRLNSSINFAMELSLHVISESKIWPSIEQNRRFVRANGRNHALRRRRRGLRGSGVAEIVALAKVQIFKKQGGSGM